MVRIDEIKVKGFKNIKSADLKLGNFNVIIGANNSGKSNFIQVISFLNYVVNSSLDEVEKSFSNTFSNTFLKQIIPQTKTLTKTTLEDFSKQGVTEIELIFSNSNTNRIFNYKLDIEWQEELFDKVESHKIKFESLDVKDAKKTGPPINIFKRKYEKVKYGNEFSKMEVIEKVPNHLSVLRLFKIISQIKNEYKDAISSLNEILKTPTYYFSHIELLKTDKERVNSFNGRLVSFELEEEIKKLEESEKWEIFKDSIKNILNIEDAHIKKIGSDSRKDKIPVTKFLIFTHNGTYKSINDFSDGTLLIIAIITKILSNQNNILFIEEPENSTHPRALIDLISFLKSFSESTQFVITSHSLAILNKTRIEDIIASSIDEDGLSELYNISSRKELRDRLKRSKVNFSDELFFNIDDKNEFE